MGYDKLVESNEYKWTTIFDPSVPNNIIPSSPSPFQHLYD